MRQKKKRQWWIRSISLIIGVITMFSLNTMDALAAYELSNFDMVEAGQSKYFIFDSLRAASFFIFSPTETGLYTFESTNSTGNPSFYMYLLTNFEKGFDAVMTAGAKTSLGGTNALVIADDQGTNKNFKTSYKCYAGTDYVCLVTRYSAGQSCTGTFKVSGVTKNTVILDKRGGSGGTTTFLNSEGAAWLNDSSTTPISSITPPTKSEYTFTGYYNALSGGIQYIASNGYLNPVAKKLCRDALCSVEREFLYNDIQ